MAVADASFRISMDTMSFGLIVERPPLNSGDAINYNQRVIAPGDGTRPSHGDRKSSVKIPACLPYINSAGPAPEWRPEKMGPAGSVCPSPKFWKPSPSSRKLSECRTQPRPPHLKICFRNEHDVDFGTVTNVFFEVLIAYKAENENGILRQQINREASIFISNSTSLSPFYNDTYTRKRARVLFCNFSGTTLRGFDSS
jgi:hypothetical protein